MKQNGLATRLDRAPSVRLLVLARFLAGQFQTSHRTAYRLLELAQCHFSKQALSGRKTRVIVISLRHGKYTLALAEKCRGQRGVACHYTTDSCLQEFWRQLLRQLVQQFEAQQAVQTRAHQQDGNGAVQIHLVQPVWRATRDRRQPVRSR